MKKQVFIYVFEQLVYIREKFTQIYCRYLVEGE